jgi:ATP-binding cassette subfamily B (MDR/TAP) protein 1
MIASVTSIVSGLAIAFAASWIVTLISLSAAPIMLICGAILAKLFNEKEKEISKQSKECGVFQEVCVNMRTVCSLNCQQDVVKYFDQVVEKENLTSVGRLTAISIVVGFSHFAVFAVYALTFWAGSEMLLQGKINFKQMFRALLAVMMAADGTTQSRELAGNMQEAMKAAGRIFDFMDVNNTVFQDPDPITTPIEGKIVFKGVRFTYPQRKSPCFDGLDLEIKPKQKVAFAGPSGGGKSTIFSLLYRFYDTTEGQILVDDVDIKKYDIKHLRKSLGMVSQEPVLFNDTIKYNIKYNDPNITDDQMIEAATVANAMNFITKDERENTDQKGPRENSGFDRQVGLKGAKLSGGQKQRVAIARTVARKPQVYMFDESTSALDAESEKKVQEALNKISSMNTSLAIAHRISTIKDSDVIFVIDAGKISEFGTYSHLLNIKGLFYTLNSEE